MYNFIMASLEKILEKILRGTSDANIAFTDLCSILTQLGFSERIRGSHHIFFKEGVVEIINPMAQKQNLIKRNKFAILF